MKSRVTYSSSARAFIWRGPFVNRSEPAKALFRLHPEKKVWYTTSYLAAARLRDLMDEQTQKELNRKLLVVSPWAESLLYPPGETPLEIQIEGAVFALSRNRSYLGFDPGLGKTIIAILIMNALDKAALAKRIKGETGALPPLFVYVCPRFLAENVAEEFRRWRTFPGPIRILDKEPEESEWPSLLIVPDSLIHRDAHKDELAWYLAYSEKFGPRSVIGFVDEAHRFNFPETERTCALLGYDAYDGDKFTGHVQGLADRFDKTIYLSGTPTNGRLIELYPILSHSAPETINFMNRWDYGDRYCDPQDDGFGRTYLGATRVPELAKRIQPFMLRKRKSLLKLPPRIQEMLTVSADMDARLSALDIEIARKYSPEDLIQAEIKKQAVADKLLGEEDDLALATYRRLLGDLKVSFTVEIVSALLEETEESILVGCVHTAPLLALATHLKKYNPYVVYGKVKPEDRLALVKDFQASKDRRLFLGKLSCMGIGYTLTKATRAILMEYSYSPSVNDQFIDRLHRIGQTDTVYAQYIALKNSHDKRVLEVFLKKSKTTEQI